MSAARALRLGLGRTLVELRMYVRERSAVVFGFALPILMLVLFATIFDSQFRGDQHDGGMTAAGFFLPGMIASAVALSSFQTMTLSVASERQLGELKRLRSTPLPVQAYLVGKVGLVLVTSSAQLLALLVVAHLGYGARLPLSAAAWGYFSIVLALGIASGTALGIAYSSIIADVRSSDSTVVAPVLILQMISGVYFAFRDIPGWLQHVAAVFPLKWVAQGMRSVLFPDDMVRYEMSGSWERPTTVLVLVAWLLVGLAVSVRRFRWTDPEEG